jgi:phospholipase C
MQSTGPPRNPRPVFRFRGQHRLKVAPFAVILVLVTPGVGVLERSASSPAPTTFIAQLSSRIDHIIIVFQENHAYDSMFATYCLHSGPYCNGRANGGSIPTCVTMADYHGSGYPAGSCPAGEINLWNFTAQNLTNAGKGGPHGMVATIEAMCGTTSVNLSCLGKNPLPMDGFWASEGKQYNPFGHFNGSTLPVYWDIAEEFGIDDNFFSSDPSYSLPNHWLMVAGQAPLQAQQGVHSKKTEDLYLNESNVTQTAQDIFKGAPVSWKYYDFALASYNKSIANRSSATNFWNPLAARNESYLPEESSHIVPRSDFWDDVRNDTLPNVSWIIPADSYSDHGVNFTHGENWVANITDTIENSPYWDSTAIFVTWDEFGGAYDHVTPPQKSWVTSVDAATIPGNSSNRLAFRVPLLVISAYTPAFTIEHELGSFDSLLRLIERRWGLPCVNASLPSQDCGAPMLKQFFNFSMTPREPCFFPLNMSRYLDPSYVSYPMTSCAPALAPVAVGGELSATYLAEPNGPD